MGAAQAFGVLTDAVGIALLAVAAVALIVVVFAGVTVAIATRPTLSNLIARVQLAISRRIRVDHAVVVENEFGFVEKITATHAVVRLWDWRRLTVPLSYFTEKPLQTWRHDNGAQIGSVTVRADFTVPVSQVRTKLHDIVQASPLWDGRVVSLQVTNADDRSVELRALASANSAPAAFDLRCHIREKLIEYLAREHPRALPHQREQALATIAAPAAQEPAPRANLVSAEARLGRGGTRRSSPRIGGG